VRCSKANQGPRSAPPSLAQCACNLNIVNIERRKRGIPVVRFFDTFLASSMVRVNIFCFQVDCRADGLFITVSEMSGPCPICYSANRESKAAPIVTVVRSRGRGKEVIVWCCTTVLNSRFDRGRLSVGVLAIRTRVQHLPCGTGTPLASHHAFKSLSDHDSNNQSPGA